MVVNTEAIRNTALQMNELMKNVPRQIERIKKEVSLCDQETSDLLHLLELTKFHASEGYRIAKDIQITQIKRRELKDELDSLITVNAMMGKHGTMVKQSESLSVIIGQEKGKQKKRKYTPRVRADLAHRFNKS